MFKKLYIDVDMHVVFYAQNMLTRCKKSKKTNNEKPNSSSQEEQGAWGSRPGGMRLGLQQVSVCPECG